MGGRCPIGRTLNLHPVLDYTESMAIMLFPSFPGTEEFEKQELIVPYYSKTLIIKGNRGLFSQKRIQDIQDRSGTGWYHQLWSGKAVGLLVTTITSAWLTIGVP